MHIQLDNQALLRQLILRSVGWPGPLSASELVITNSCTEALALCVRAVTRPGDTVAVESPAYYLMLQLLESAGLKALEIPTDPRRGLSIEALELATRDGRVAACLLVAAARLDSPALPVLAWAYVAARLAHSAIQLGANRVRWRFMAFAASAALLLALWCTVAVALVTAAAKR
jgi:hypothetical protein